MDARDAGHSTLNAENASTIFDPQAALQLCAGNSDLLQDMIEFFLKESSNLQVGLGEALKRGDAAALAQIAHRLKGTVVYLGAPPICAAAQRLEDIARAGDLRQAAAAVEELQFHARQLTEAVQAK